MPGLNLTPLDPSGRGRGSRKPLEGIPAMVAETVEEAWEYFSDTANAGKRLETPPFTSKETAEDFLSDCRAYAYWRGETKGRLVVSGNVARAPKKGEFVARFTVEAYEAPETAADATE